MVQHEITFLPKQKEVLQHPARFKILACGRRWGKSQMSSYKIIIEALKKTDGVYWIVSPTYPQTKIIWRMIKKFMPKQAIKRIMEGELYIELKMEPQFGQNPVINPIILGVKVWTEWF